MKDKIAEAKRRMPMPDLLAHYGMPDRAKKNANSPFRPDSDSNAFGIFQKKDGTWNWKDFVTGEFGDEIDFIEKYENRSKEDAAIKFFEIAGMQESAKPQAKLRRRFEAEEEPQMSGRAHDEPFDWSQCSASLTDEGVAEIAKWRGVSGEIVASLRDSELIGVYDGLVAFPVADSHGGVISAHVRQKDGSWRFRPRGTSVTPLVLGDLKEARHVFIFESQWDAIAVADKMEFASGNPYGIALVSTRGASNGGLVKGLVTTDARITGWPQNDPQKNGSTPPSERWWADVSEALEGRPLYRAETPKEHKDANDWVKAGADANALWEAFEGAKDPKISMLLDREFDFSSPPKRTTPVIWLGDVGVAKPCDLVAISAQVKAGKSSVVGAIISCLMSNKGDFLGFRGENQPGNTILHFDTEQSPEDHYDLVTRAMTRGNLSSPPKFLRSFCLTDLSVDRRKDALRNALKRLPGPFSAVLIDGVADLCNDVNDAEEANTLVDTLYRWAIDIQAPIICVLHENPGTTTGKTRGHLGSQLERKAATNLRLDKGSDGKIEIFTEKARRGHIAKGSGPCFEWSEIESMHVSCPTRMSVKMTARDRAKAQSLYEIACDVFNGNSMLQWADLVNGIMNREAKSRETAKRRVDEMRRLNVIHYFAKDRVYSVNPHFSEEGS